MLGTGTTTEITSAAELQISSRALGPGVDTALATAEYPRVRWAHLAAPLKTAVALVATDQAAACCCIVLATAATWLAGIPLELGAALPVCVCGALLIGNWAFDLYPGIGINPVIETRQVIVSSTSSIAMVFIAMQAAQAGGGVALLLAAVWIFSLAILPIGRMIARGALSRFAWWRQPIVILGDGENAQQVAARLRRWRTLGLEPIGHIHDFHDHWKEDGPSAAPGRPAGGELHYMGPPQDVAELVRERGVQWAILALPQEHTAGSKASHAELIAAAQLFPHVLVVDDACTLPSLWSKTIDIDGWPARYTHRVLGHAPRKLKRAMDVLGAGLLVLLLAPVLVLLALSIRFSSPGPVLYAQERIGRGGRRFRAWKFRTMIPDAERALADHLKAHPELEEEWTKNHKLRNDPRVIPGIGRILRNYSLDELPQLWNVLCGEMSLVGPRPIVEEEIAKYQQDFAMYVQVTPGITGLWQVSGRNNTTYTRRVALDSYYIRNWSPWLDYYILLRTFKTVALREGAY